MEAVVSGLNCTPSVCLPGQAAMRSSKEESNRTTYSRACREGLSGCTADFCGTPSSTDTWTRPSVREELGREMSPSTERALPGA